MRWIERSVARWRTARHRAAERAIHLLSFFEELAAGFDPIVVGVAGQRELHATLGEEIGAEADVVVRRFGDLWGGGSFSGIGGWDAGSGLFPGSRSLFLRLGRGGFCFWLGS